MEVPQHEHRNVKISRCGCHYVSFLNQRGCSWAARNRMVLVLFWAVGRVVVMTAARFLSVTTTIRARRCFKSGDLRLLRQRKCSRWLRAT
jgi:hypothetical protein